MSAKIGKLRRGSTALAVTYGLRLTHLTKERLSYYAREYDFDINTMLRDHIENELLPTLDRASREEDKKSRLEQNQDDEPVTLA